MPDHFPQALGRMLATKRFRPYAATFGGDQRKGAELYLLNIELSGAVLELLHFVEVGLRDRIHEEMTQTFGRRWFMNASGALDSRTMKKVKEATKRLGKYPDPGKTVADLNFGFWTDLLTIGGPIYDRNLIFVRHADYENELWAPAMHRVFGNDDGPEARKRAERVVRRVQRVRNRVAHHESLVFGVPQVGEKTAEGKHLRRTPTSMMGDIRELGKIVCSAEVSAWMETCNHAEELLGSELAHLAFDRALTSLQDVEWV